jgi:hypothetical protein
MLTKKVSQFLLASIPTLSLLLTPNLAAAESYNPNRVYQAPKNFESYRGRPCNDPWVTIALQIVTGSANPAYCSPSLYNGGQWNSFNQLVHAVGATTQQLNSQGVTLQAVKIQGGVGIAVFQSGRSLAVLDRSLVAAGAGSLVAAGAGSLVAAGAGSFQFSQRYGLMGVRTEVRLPKGALILR